MCLLDDKVADLPLIEKNYLNPGGHNKTEMNCTVAWFQM